MTNPLQLILTQGIPAVDVGVMHHGFAEHGRDYLLILENSIGHLTGTFRLTFSHVVELNYVTAVREGVWQRSWTDEFIDYERWQAEGEPDGYIFGTNWSAAYPGFEALDGDPLAKAWTEKLSRPMFAANIETDRFKIKLIYHDAHLERIDDQASTVSKVILPLS